MCGAIKASTGEKLRTEDFLRRILGEGAKDWVFDGAIREEGLQIDEESGLITFGNKKRFEIIDLFTYQVDGFYDRSKATKRELWFPTPGWMLITLHKTWKNDNTNFGYVSVADPRMALCRHPRGLLVLPKDVDIPTLLKVRQQKAA